MSLVGKNIVITRPRDQATELVAELERRGARPIVLPAIRVVPPDRWDECDRSIDLLGTFDAVFFTSANAVEYFCQRCGEYGPANWRDLLHTTYVVGEKTAHVLGQYGIAASVPELYSAAGVLDMLEEDQIRDKKFLLPRGDQAREELADGLTMRGAQVLPVTVYRTIGPAPETVEHLRRAFRRHEVDVVTFFSPSAVRHFIDALDNASLAELGKKVLTAVIGHTTYTALADRKIPVSVTAPHATAASLVEAIEEYLAKGAVPA